MLERGGKLMSGKPMPPSTESSLSDTLRPIQIQVLQGKLIAAQEITKADATITWHARLVNRKAAEFRFTDATQRRNNATGNDATDSDLIIDSGVVKATGTAPVNLIGQFRGQAVRLGDVRLEPDGQLIVCGGFGRSESTAAVPAIQGFADSDDWFDDVSDGPIHATLRLNGTAADVPVRSAWLLVGPPDFAPEIQNLVTLYDIAPQTALQSPLLPISSPISFARHILPILARASNYQWVNRLAGGGHDGSRPRNFLVHAAELQDLSLQSTKDMAASVLNRLRDSRPQVPPPDPQEPMPNRWMPRLHDETNSNKRSPRLTS